MNNVEHEVNKLYERSANLREIANQEEESENPTARTSAPARARNRRIIRAMMLVVGIGMIAYGIVFMVFGPGAEDMNATPTPSAGIMDSNETYLSCEDALTATNDGSVSYTSEASQGISAEEAEQISDRLLKEYLEYDKTMYPTLLAGPALVDVILPGGTTQQAWSRLWVPQLRDEDQESSSSARGVSAHVLYISSDTGEPLLLVEDINLQDPLLAGCTETGVQEFLERVKAPGKSPLIGTILNISLFVVGVAILGFWQKGR